MSVGFQNKMRLSLLRFWMYMIVPASSSSWVPETLALSYTHDGLEQAGRREEPQHSDSRRHGASRHEPQQQIGQDTKRRGKNQPDRQTSWALLNSAPEGGVLH